jgi:tartrate dehydrogenase/decarboxylase / D-malate dehydrogenase
VTDLRIAVIPGDGIGTEVVPAAIRCLEATGVGFTWTDLPWGTDLFLRHGHFMPPGGLDELRKHDAIFFGAVGRPDVPDAESLWGLLIPIRRGLGQYVNLRPVRSVPGVDGPLRDHPRDIDMVIVRENSEGEYSELGGRLRDPDLAMQTAVFTRQGISRITRYACELAASRKGTLVSATKSNGIIHTNTFWDEVVSATAAAYPDVTVERVLVDALAARLVLAPQSADVIVASNLYGDILSDLTAALAGSIGVAASGNINPERTAPSMFEPVHGSAPDIAGRGIANPLGQLNAAVMMLSHLRLPDAALRLEAAVNQALTAGTRTPDLGGDATTESFADAVISYLNSPVTPKGQLR